VAVVQPLPRWPHAPRAGWTPTIEARPRISRIAGFLRKRPAQLQHVGMGSLELLLALRQLATKLLEFPFQPSVPHHPPSFGKERRELELVRPQSAHLYRLDDEW